MARKRPTRRRQQLEIEPLNWVAPEASEEQSDERLEQDDQDQSDKKQPKASFYRKSIEYLTRRPDACAFLFLDNGKNGSQHIIY